MNIFAWHLLMFWQIPNVYRRISGWINKSIPTIFGWWDSGETNWWSKNSENQNTTMIFDSTNLNTFGLAEKWIEGVHSKVRSNNDICIHWVGRKGFTQPKVQMNDRTGSVFRATNIYNMTEIRLFRTKRLISFKRNRQTQKFLCLLAQFDQSMRLLCVCF